MNPFDPMSSRRKGMTSYGDKSQEEGITPNLLSELVEKSRKAEFPMSEGLKEPTFGSQFAAKPVSMTEQAPRQYSLGANTDFLKKQSDGLSPEETAELIKGGAKALGAAMEQQAAQKELESKVGQESALQHGKSRRENMSRAGRATHRGLAELMASFRGATS